MSFCFYCVPTPAFAQATNYALSFNAAQSQSVTIPHLAAQDGYPFTVMCWFMEPTNSSGNGAFVGNYVSSTFNGWQLASSGGQLYAWYYRANGDDVGRTTAGPINDGLWHQAAFVVTSAGGVIYLDGVPKLTNTWAGTAGPCTATGNIYLGLYQGDSFLTADLDEVSVWNVALTPAQIQTYMYQPLNGTETGLVNYYRMNEGSGTNIYDSTINADTGTFPPSPNSPTWILSGVQFRAPQVATLPATASANSATLSGTVNPEGANTGSWFNWGLSTNYGNVTTTNTFAGLTVSTNIITLSNLSLATYHFQIVATNANGTNYGADQSFSITEPPLVTTLPATVNGNSATLNGTVNPQGLNSGSWFNWGLTTNYGNVTATNTFAVGYSLSTNTITLSSLSPGTYHFQIVATNADGTNYGSDQSFSITGPPQVATLPATANGNLATLSGTVDPEGLASGSWFNWGLTTSYGNATTTNVFAAGYGVATNISTVSNLSPATYHYQIAAINIDGTNYGADQTFNITGPPQVTTLPATVTGNSAVLNGTVNPQGLNSGSWFNWGLTANYGNVTATNIFSAGYSLSTNTITLSNLSPGTYHYQIVAINADGTNYGPDQIFSITGPPQVATLPATASGNLATLNGTVDPEGLYSGAWFNWGLTTSYGNVTTTNVFAAGYGVSISMSTIGNLSPTTYHYQIAAINIDGTNYGADQTFNITAPPQAVTLPATVNGNSAALNGTVNPQGLDSGSLFNWGLTTNYGNVTATNIFSAGYANSTNTITLSNLSLATYHFQIVAINADGTNYGADQTFSITGPPQVATLPATVFANSATLSGTVNPEGIDSGSWFNWGLTTNYGNVNTPNIFSAGYTISTNTETLSGVLNGTYHFQIVAANADGTNFGADQSFTIYVPFQIGTSNLLVGPSVGTDSVILAANVSWTVTPNASWLHVSSPFPSSGVGSTNIIFTLDANPGPTRTGTISISDQTLTVTQAGSNYVAAPEPAITLATNGLQYPVAVAVDAAGNAYIADLDAGIFEWVKTNDTLTTLVSGNYESQGIAVDRNGNVYFSSTSSSSILEWVAASGQVVTVVSSGLANPTGIAMDSAGNVYIADTGHGAIKEWVAANSNVVTLVSNGITAPNGVAVDPVGNVYFTDISDSPYGEIHKWSPTAGMTTLPGFSPGNYQPFNLAVDGSGNVYFADGHNYDIWEWSAVNQTVNLVASRGIVSIGVALDSAGNIFIANWTEPVALKELPHAFINTSPRAEPFIAGTDTLAVLPTNAIQFAPFIPASDESWLTITGVTNGVTQFSFPDNYGLPRVAHINQLTTSIEIDQSAVILGTTSLLEGPAAGTDSVMLAVPPPIVPLNTSVNGAWLHPAAVYQPNINGTNIIIAWDANPGPTRTGSIFIGSGGVGQTITVTQAGAPYVAAPAPLATLVPYGTGAAFVQGMVVDNEGNVYFTDPANHAVKEWVAANNSVIILSAHLSIPTGLAMDNVDDLLFIADEGAGALYVCALPDPRLLKLATPGPIFATSIAVDEFDNVYFVNATYSILERWNIDNGNVSELITNMSPSSITLDNAGNIYMSGGTVSGTNNFGVLEWIAATSNLVTRVSGVSGSVAVDGSGNIYIENSGGIDKWSAITGNLSPIVSGPFNPAGIYVDNNRDVYIADAANGAVEELPRAFVDPAPRMEPYPGGTDALPPILPAGDNLLQPPFVPVTDQPWLTVTNANAADGIVDFDFTSNIGPLSPRTAHITVLGESVTVIQTNAPVIPPNLTGARMLPNGSFQFTFTNSPGTTFTVLATTNLALPLAQWINVGTVSNSSPGIYQFTTQPLTNAQEFYQVIWP